MMGFVTKRPPSGKPRSAHSALIADCLTIAGFTRGTCGAHTCQNTPVKAYWIFAIRVRRTDGAPCVFTPSAIGPGHNDCVSIDRSNPTVARSLSKRRDRKKWKISRPNNKMIVPCSRGARKWKLRRKSRGVVVWKGGTRGRDARAASCINAYGNAQRNARRYNIILE